MRHKFLRADILAIALTVMLGTNVAPAAEPSIGIKNARGHEIGRAHV